MGLDSIIRSAIQIADSVTTSLQTTISLERWTGQNSYGLPTYAAAITLNALIEPIKRITSGSAANIEISLNYKISIFEHPTTLTGAFDPDVFDNNTFDTHGGRSEPIDPRDKVTFADGSTFPIRSIDGVMIDPTTSKPYMYIISC